MNEDLIKGIVKIKLEMAHSLIEHLPEKEAEQVLALGRIVMDAVTEYVSSPHEQTQKKGEDEIKSIVID